METPSSTARRVTRSQAMAALNNNLPLSRKVDESEKSVSKSRQRKQQDRCVLIDITNDSPIVGLAKGSVETPLSAIAKQRSGRAKGTPGSGEALLRGQVKTLLQKVEEEAEISKLTLDSRPFVHLQGYTNSPMGLLAPTPANTPQIPDLSGSNNGVVTIASPVIEQHLIAQVVNDVFEGKKGESSLESQKSLITRSLLLDFSEKSESCDSSVVTEEEAESKVKCGDDHEDDDDASVWSIQVNTSSHGEDEVDNDGELVDALCLGINQMSMNEKMPKFEGKHTRFMYDSEDELVVAPEEEEEGVLRLKGLPTPKGKHLRFLDEDEDDEN